MGTFEPGNVYDENGKCILEFTEAYHESDDSDYEPDGSDHDSDDESHHSSDDESDHGSDHDSDHSDGDFHVLPPPKSGSLDMAIEKATRVGVSMVRMQLDNFSNTM